MTRRGRRRWTLRAVAAAALVVVAATGCAVYLVTRVQTVRLHGAVELVGAGADWKDTGPGTCAPADAATSLVGSRVVITSEAGQPRASFVLGRFEDARPGCWSLFRDVNVRADDSSYLVKIGALPPARMTRDQLIAAESPDAYAGIAFLVSGCARGCTTTVKTAVELSRETQPLTPSASAPPS